MIKTLLILLLLAALMGGAWFSRPGQSDFERVALPKRPAPRNVLERLFKHPRPADVLADCDYRNRLLWTDVYLEGQRVATGAFGRFWWTEHGRQRFDPKPAFEPSTDVP